MRRCIIILCLLIVSEFVFSQKEYNCQYNFPHGTILSSASGSVADQFFEANVPYDYRMIGVFSNPPIPTSTNGDLIKLPYSGLVKEGIVEVRYNLSNGKIFRGDPITSSSVSGEAMKATQPGMILGIALEDADGTSQLIKVRISIQFYKP